MSAVRPDPREAARPRAPGEVAGALAAFDAAQAVDARAFEERVRWLRHLAQLRTTLFEIGNGGAARSAVSGA
jgi:hypothetical protein